ncbi:Potassium efflux system KefA protein [Minicystis rosea]|nr:Potassium efflux system KefA protein [Minicystis rosea]
MTSGPPDPTHRAHAPLLALVVLVAAWLSPLRARAADGVADHASGHVLARASSVVFLASAIVVTAFLVNRFAPKQRRRMRGTVITGLFYLLAYAVHVGLAILGVPEPGGIAAELTQLLGLLTAINLGVLVVFDFALAAVGTTMAPFLGSLLVVIGNIAAVVITLRHLGVELSGILATSALLTTITAFSIQGTLSNVVGGLALHIDDSIRVGDWVQLENGKQGKVREIRWRYTVIETRDWDTMIVPNATILGSTITVLGKREGQPLQHRMWIYFNVDFRYSPADVIEAVNKGLQNAPIEGVASEPLPHAICMDFAKDGRDSFAYYAVRYFLTDLAKDDPTSSRVRERIYTALRRASIPLAVPAGRVWVEQDDVERRERKKQAEVDRRHKALAGVEFLRTLHEGERDFVADRLLYALFAPGETITKQGAVAHWLYIIVSGVAEVRICIDGTNRAVAKIQAPGFVGEMGLMTGEPRTATVVALTEVECYRLDKEAFNKIMADRPEIAKEISSVLAARNVELQAVREDLDEGAKQMALEAEHRRMLGTIRRFFGLEEDTAPSSLS